MNTKEITQLLGTVELFGGLSKRALGQVVSSGRLTEHDSGHEVIAEGAGAVGFHLIVSGKAKVTSGDALRRLERELLEHWVHRDDVALEAELRVLEPGRNADELREVEDRHLEVLARLLPELRLPCVE